MTETKEDKFEFSWVRLEDVIDCPDCLWWGRGNFPISPAVGYCRRCKLDEIKESRDE